MNKQFIYKGYKCYIKGVMAHYNGYVEIPKGHFLYGTNYQDGSFPDLEVNGGITYSESFLEELEDSWFIGFDTLHSWDTPETQTPEFVEEELKKLVDQVYMIYSY